ncbi:17-beta-hydroxysteroid dehydrogenase 14-like [Mercenaria mercenaria]|uniref:17-beta-hydroxysteroid dehydrogenase 14-like n=1 Tax=Mercenaria mercenaria TaxID=6596 RepID=UPI00234F3A3C|nr:17-beta-hydroxysteroid dehydrogenase 14-like [Mercenaria mercenaria]
MSKETNQATLRFKDKVAIVTGGVQGIGRGCVDVFVEHGGKVVVFDIKDDVGKAMQSNGPGEIIYFHCDVRKEEDVKTCIEETVKRLGKIDCLVNNVGCYNGPKSIDEYTVQDFRDLLDDNLISNFTASKYALPHIRKTNGSIVNISSISANAAFKNSTIYCATKGGVKSLTKALAIDEAKYGVRVNSIAPGCIESPLLRQTMPTEKMETLESCHTMQRTGQPREIGLACLFLAVDATFTTGEELMCTGGSEIGYGVKNTGLMV